MSSEQPIIDLLGAIHPRSDLRPEVERAIDLIGEMLSDYSIKDVECACREVSKLLRHLMKKK